MNARQILAAGGACAAAVATPAAIALGAGAPDSVDARAPRAPVGSASAAERELRTRVHAELHGDVRRLVREVARLRGRRPSARALHAVDRLSTPELQRRRRELRRERHSVRHPARAAVSPALEAIAACESGGDPRAVGGGGRFRGKYQFDVGTWAAVGGSGDPAAASEAEQDRRAATLYARRGAAPWPVCGR